MGWANDISDCQIGQAIGDDTVWRLFGGLRNVTSTRNVQTTTTVVVSAVVDIFFCAMVVSAPKTPINLSVFCGLWQSSDSFYKYMTLVCGVVSAAARIGLLPSKPRRYPRNGRVVCWYDACRVFVGKTQDYHKVVGGRGLVNTAQDLGDEKGRNWRRSTTTIFVDGTGEKPKQTKM